MISQGTATYKSDAFGVESETTGGATTYYTRMPGGRLVDERIGTSAYYYLFDGLGSVVALIDTSATVQDTYSYDPYGNVTATGTVANPWQYTGGYYDGATGLVKLGQRFYDPSVGRFTQLDPKGGGYGYASDDPINVTDRSGLDGCVDPDAGGGSSNCAGSGNIGGDTPGGSSSGNNTVADTRAALPTNDIHLSTSDALKLAEDFLGPGYSDRTYAVEGSGRERVE